jgi:hypothetical protein
MLYLIRSKMMLLSYLISIPDGLGFKARSPYLDFDVSMSMLTIEEERRKNRVWQKDFISKHNLDVEFLDKKTSTRNDLDFDAMNKVPLTPLNVEVLSRYFNRDYINWINRNANSRTLKNYFSHSILASRYMGKVASKFGVQDTSIKAHSAYMTIKPIEVLILKSIEERKR